MRAAHEAAAAHLVHHQIPLGPPPAHPRLKLNQPVHHGMLCRREVRIGSRTREQHHGAIGEIRLDLQFMK